MGLVNPFFLPQVAAPEEHIGHPGLAVLKWEMLCKVDLCWKGVRDVRIDLCWPGTGLNRGRPLRLVV